MDAALCTVEFFKQFMDSRQCTHTYDSRFDTLLVTASSLLEVYTRNSFYARVYTQRFDTRETLYFEAYCSSPSFRSPEQKCFLDGFLIDPDSSIQAMTVYYYPFAYDAPNPVVLTRGTDWYYDDRKMCVKLLKRTRKGRGTIKIVYAGGFGVQYHQHIRGGFGTAETIDGTSNPGAAIVEEVVSPYPVYMGVPTDLQMACTTQAMYMFEKMWGGGLGLSQPSDSKSSKYEKYTSNDMICDEAANLAQNYQRLMVGRL